MGIRQAMARSLSAIFVENFEGSTLEAMLYMDMDSTPPAMPTSMTPERMLEAMFATACSPLLHCRFTVLSGISKGRSPMNWAMREVTAPAPGWETLPIWMSPTAAGSSFVRSLTALKRGASSSSHGVSLKEPRFAFAMAVRTAQQMTTSSSDFSAVLMAEEVGAIRSGASAPVATTCPAMRCRRFMAARGVQGWAVRGEGRGGPKAWLEC
mmetsp:Transcript_99126/g.300887  ORF Transcript_99126/g.300887 Transcript_99126/m.300887 type:complete len:210 (-) Transcript_99126:10-639(-)